MRVFEPIHQFPGAQSCGFRVPSRACRRREKSELLVLVHSVEEISREMCTDYFLKEKKKK